MRILLGVILTLGAYTYGHLIGAINPIQGLVLALGILGLTIIAAEVVLALRGL